MSKLYFVDSSTAAEYWTELLDEPNSIFCIFYNEETSAYDFSNILDNDEFQKRIKFFNCSENKGEMISRIGICVEHIIEAGADIEITVIADEDEIDTRLASLKEHCNINIIHSFDSESASGDDAESESSYKDIIESLPPIDFKADAEENIAIIDSSITKAALEFKSESGSKSDYDQNAYISSLELTNEAAFNDTSDDMSVKTEFDNTTEETETQDNIGKIEPKGKFIGTGFNKVFFEVASAVAMLAIITVLSCFVFADETPVEKIQLVNTISPIEWQYESPDSKVRIIETADEPDYSNLSETDLIKVTIYQRGEAEGLDGLLMVAISRLETGNYTSKAFLNYNNICGATAKSGVCQYASFDEGLDAFVKIMKWYQKRGMTTPATMAKTYCPPNKKWPDHVAAIMEEERNNSALAEYYE